MDSSTIIQAMRPYVPDYWQKVSLERRQNVLTADHSVYKDVKAEVERAASYGLPPIKKIFINETLLDYAQLLLRAELQIKINKYSTYYRVRRYVKIKESQLTAALKYNLDYRRCHHSRNFSFTKKIDTVVDVDDIVLIVQVITDNPDASSIECSNSSEYFIDFIVKF